MVRVNINEFKTDNSSKETFYYTSLGSESFIDKEGFPSERSESKLTCAKKIKDKQSKRFSGETGFSFYIKAYGAKKIYNPYTKHTIEKNNNPSRIENMCKSSEYFLEVNEYVFNKYLNYLKTKNKHWFIEVQKDIN
jgi:hypothetical protein